MNTDSPQAPIGSQLEPQRRERCAALTFTFGFIACSALLFCLVGCRTPDLKPFRDSTSSIQDSVTKAQERFVDDLGLLRKVSQSNPQASKRFDDILTRFTNHWAARISVTETFVDYAQSLAALAEAPSKARKNSEAVASSLKAMSTAFGIYGQALQGTADLAIELESAASSVRATRELRKAVNAADASVQAVAQVLVHDFQGLAAELKRLDSDLEPILSQGVANRLDLRSLLSTNLESSVATLRAAASKPDWVNAVKDFNATAAAVAKYFDEDARWTGPYFQEMKDGHTQLRSDIQLLQAAEKAIAAWAKSHGRLRKALEGGLDPDWTQLKQSAENIDKAIKSLTQHAN